VGKNCRKVVLTPRPARDKVGPGGSRRGVGNIICEQRDVLQHGFGLEPDSQDACLLFNIMHCEEPLRILGEAACVVGRKGAVHVIHWRYDSTTPRGPSMEIRPQPEQILEWGSTAGLIAGSDPVLDLPPWHFGVRFWRA